MTRVMSCDVHVTLMQNLDALSANIDMYSYDVPSAAVLAGMASVVSNTTSSCAAMGTLEDTPTETVMRMDSVVIQDNFTSSFTLNFSLLRTLVRPTCQCQHMSMVCPPFPGDGPTFDPVRVWVPPWLCAGRGDQHVPV